MVNIKRYKNGEKMPYKYVIKVVNVKIKTLMFVFFPIKIVVHWFLHKATAKLMCILIFYMKFLKNSYTVCISICTSLNIYTYTCIYIGKKEKPFHSFVPEESTYVFIFGPHGADNASLIRVILYNFYNKKEYVTTSKYSRLTKKLLLCNLIICHSHHSGNGAVEIFWEWRFGGCFILARE